MPVEDAATAKELGAHGARLDALATKLNDAVDNLTKLRDDTNGVVDRRHEELMGTLEAIRNNQVTIREHDSLKDVVAKKADRTELTAVSDLVKKNATETAAHLGISDGKGGLFGRVGSLENKKEKFNWLYLGFSTAITVGVSAFAIWQQLRAH